MSASCEKYRTLFAGLGIDAYCVLDRDGRVLDWLDAQDRFGIATETARGKRIPDLCSPVGGKQLFEQLLNELPNRHVGTVEVTVQRQLPNPRTFVATLFSLAGSDIPPGSAEIAWAAVGFREISKEQLTDEETHSTQDGRAKVYRALADNVPACIFTMDAQGTVLSINRAAELLLGYREEELVGVQTPLLWHDPVEVQRRAQQLTFELGRFISPGIDALIARVSAGRADVGRWTYIGKAGQRRTVELTMSLVTRGLSGETEYLGIASDITDRVFADEALRASEERVRLANRFAGVGVWDWDVKGNKTVWDDLMFHIYGIPKVLPVEYETWRRVVVPEDIPPVEAGLRKVVEAGIAQDYSFRIYHGLTGELRYIRGACGPVFNEQGRVARVVGINFDVTPLVEASERLKKSEETFSTAFRASPAFMTIVRRSDRVVMEVNQAFERAMEFSAADAVGKTTAQLKMRDRTSDIDALFDRIYQGESIRNHEQELITRSGRKLRVLFSAEPIQIAGEDCVIFSGVNITQRIEAENALRDSEALLRAVFETTNAGLSLTGPDGKFVAFNPAFAAMVGRNHDQILGQDPADFTHPDDWQRQRPLIRELNAGTRNEYKLRKRYVKPDGAIVWIELSVAAVRRPDGSFAYGVGVAVDITEQYLLEENFRQSQKMEAIGRLAGGVAHDFNNLLTVIANHCEVLKVRLGEQNPLIASVRAIGDAGDRAASLTRQLLAYSRKQRMALTVVDVNTVIAETRDIFDRLLGERIRMKYRLHEQTLPVQIDRSQLEQVLMNLVLNARDAIADSGDVEITTDLELRRGAGGRTAQPSSPSDATVGPNERAQPHETPYAVLSVRDTGNGIAREHLTQIFEPFFTTKEVGKGTGLGLAVVQGVVAQSGGFIEVQSEAGHGTTIRVFLPTSTREVHKAAREVSPNKKLSGSETILLVEDDRAVREATVAALERYGYRVIAAADGNQLLQQLDPEWLQQADLLLTDVMMPGMSGCELAEALLANRPTLRVLYVSGYVGPVNLDQRRDGPAIGFLPKPYTPDILLAKVRQMIDQAVT